MRKTLMAMIAAAAVLIIGGSLGALAQTEDTTGEDTAPIEETVRPLRGHLLGGALDDMVADGVIDTEQATAIGDWLENRRAEFQAEHEARRAAHEAAWADDVLTAEEAADLPGAERLLSEDGPFADAWEDGQLTRDEFDAIKAELGGPRGPRGPGHRGPGMAFGAGEGAPNDA